MNLVTCRSQAQTPAASACEAVTAGFVADVVARWAGVVFGADAGTVYAAEKRNTPSACVGSTHTDCSSGTGYGMLLSPQSRGLMTAGAAKVKRSKRPGSRLLVSGCAFGWMVCCYEVSY